MTSEQFWRILTSRGFTFFSGVPCSILKEVLEDVERDPEVTYVPAPREEAALGVASPFKDRPEIFERYGIDAEFYASETPESFLEMQLSCSA